MKILHLRSSGGFYGAEGVILNLARELNAMGCESHIVCIRSLKNPHQELADVAKKSGLSASIIDSTGRVDFATVKAIRALILEKKIDILHCHDYKANMLGFLAARGLNIKRVTTNHLWTSETAILRIYELFDGLLGNCFDKVVGVSRPITDQVKGCLLRKDKALTIYNGIDLKHFQPGPDNQKGTLRNEFNISDTEPVIGAVGRLSVQKGYNYLLEALKIMAQKGCSFRLIFIGSGDEQESLQARTKELGLESYVNFAGVRRDMANVYRSLDVFVLSSIAEGLPLVLCEALAMKVPVVATKVGAIADVVEHEQTALLCASKDVDALAENLIRILTDKSLRSKLAANGRRLAEEKLSSQAMAKHYLELYRSLLQPTLIRK